MTYSSTILADSPQAYYRLNENSGTTAHDSSGNGYTGTLVGVATYSVTGGISGDTDTALAFTATGGLRLPRTLNYTTFSAFSLEYWINVPGNGWHYVVIVTNGSTTTLYLDNVSVTSGSGSGLDLLASQLFDWGGNDVAATLDEVAIYNVALTSGQVNTHWTAAGGTTSGGSGGGGGAVGTGNPLGHELAGMARIGDGYMVFTRGLTAQVPIGYTISPSKYNLPLPLSYTVMHDNVASMLIYYVITPPSAFAINNDGSIIAPDRITYVPRAVSTRTLLAEPLLQGYATMNWLYSAIEPANWAKLVSYYDPQNPVVLLVYPDESGTWRQHNARMMPPTWGSWETTLVSGAQISFIIPPTSS